MSNCMIVQKVIWEASSLKGVENSVEENTIAEPHPFEAIKIERLKGSSYSTPVRRTKSLFNIEDEDEEEEVGGHHEGLHIWIRVPNFFVIIVE